MALIVKTPTQPQSNLTQPKVVGLDTKITLHTTTTHRPTETQQDFSRKCLAWKDFGTWIKFSVSPSPRVRVTCCWWVGRGRHIRGIFLSLRKAYISNLGFLLNLGPIKKFCRGRGWWWWWLSVTWHRPSWTIMNSLWPGEGLGLARSNYFGPNSKRKSKISSYFTTCLSRMRWPSWESV